MKGSPKFFHNLVDIINKLKSPPGFTERNQELMEAARALKSFFKKDCNLSIVHCASPLNTNRQTSKEFN